MPRSLIGPDGNYLDGTLPDPISAALARSGNEEEFFLIAGGVLLVMFVAAFRMILRSDQMEKDGDLRKRFGLPPRSEQ